MQWIDLIILAIVIVTVSLAAVYVYKQKKNGKRCIGCPNSGSCATNCGGCAPKDL